MLNFQKERLYLAVEAHAVAEMALEEAIRYARERTAFGRLYLVERIYRDSRLFSIGGGTYEIMNEVISKQMGL